MKPGRDAIECNVKRGTYHHEQSIDGEYSSLHVSKTDYTTAGADGVKSLIWCPTGSLDFGS